MSEVTEQPGASSESTTASAAPASPSPATADSSLFGSSADNAADDGETVLASDADAAQQLADDEAEEELEGVKLRGKKEAIERVKNERLMQADYTRKTQEAAENRRQWEAQQQTDMRMSQVRAATLQEQARLIAVDQQLEQYKAGIQQAIQAGNPAQAQAWQMDLLNLRQQRAEMAQGIAQKQQAMTFHEQQISAKRVEEGRRELERDIKGWSPEVAGKCLQVAKSFGFRDEELTNVSDPRTVKLLHEVLTLRQTVAKQSVKPPPTPLPKPVTQLKGAGATNTKALSELSVEELQARRNESRRR